MARCSMGMWNMGNRERLTLREHLSLPRGEDDCFFIPWKEGMSFEGATALHRLKYDNRQLKKSHRLTQRALWIAAAGVVVSAISQLPTVYAILRDFFSYLLKLV